MTLLNAEFMMNSEYDNEKISLNILADRKAKIDKMELDGKEWTLFNPAEGFIILPKGWDMKVNIRFKS